MFSIERIQHLPEHQREKILWAVVAAVLLVMLLLWIVTSRIPRNPQRPQDFFAAIQRRAQSASANFPK